MRIIKLLRDESGDLFFQKMILIAVSFAVGAVLLSALYAVFDETIGVRLSEIIENILTW